jgi:cell division protein FtsW
VPRLLLVFLGITKKREIYLKNTSENMVRPNRPDYIFLFVVVILILFGGLILISVSLSLSKEKFGSIFYYLNHQILYGFLPGLILAFFAFKIDLNFLKKIAPPLLLINLIFLGMVFLPVVGVSFRGAARWIDLGLISFQPSELLKLSFILYLASWLASKIERKKGEFWQTFLAFLIVIGIISTFLILQPDVSTLLIIILVSSLMYFLAETPFWHTILMGLIIVLVLLILIWNAPYRFNRILVFFNPELDPMGIGYQIKQALIAIGSGGVSGLGLGLSQQKAGFLPQAISDSIFAIFAEETGFIGSTMLVLLFFLFFWRGLKIGREGQDKFSKFCAFGITFWITLQAFVNISSMIGILPLTGIPLPFISYGGSALVSELVGVGILLNVSKKT